MLGVIYLGKKRKIENRTNFVLWQNEKRVATQCDATLFNFFSKY